MMIVGEHSIASLPEEASDTPVLPVAVLIPAYKPGHVLVEIVQALAGTGPHAIVVVDDGSGPEYRWIFNELLDLPRVRLRIRTRDADRGQTPGPHGPRGAHPHHLRTRQPYFAFSAAARLDAHLFRAAAVRLHLHDDGGTG